VEDTLRPHHSMGGVAAVANFDWTYVGLELGGAGGKMRVYDADGRFIPVIGLRLGSLAGGYFETGVGDQQPAPMPQGVIRLGVGFGASPGRFNLRAGLSDVGGYGSVRFVTESGLEFEPTVATNLQTTGHFAITVRKRFWLGTGR